MKIVLIAVSVMAIILGETHAQVVVGGKGSYVTVGAATGSTVNTGSGVVSSTFNSGTVNPAGTVAANTVTANNPVASGTVTSPNQYSGSAGTASVILSGNTVAPAFSGDVNQVNIYPCENCAGTTVYGFMDVPVLSPQTNIYNVGLPEKFETTITTVGGIHRVLPYSDFARLTSVTYAVIPTGNHLAEGVDAAIVPTLEPMDPCARADWMVYDATFLKTGQGSVPDMNKPTDVQVLTQGHWYDFVNTGGRFAFFRNKPLASLVPVAAVSTQVVSMLGATFSPSQLTITAGSTVIWTNVSTVMHTVTSDVNSFSSQLIMPGGSYSLTFNAVGSYPYHCVFHGAVGGVGMSGVITVTPASTGNTANYCLQTGTQLAVGLVVRATPEPVSLARLEGGVFSSESNMRIFRIIDWRARGFHNYGFQDNNAFAEGFNFGADGVPITVSDGFSGSTPVNQLFFTGYGFWKAVGSISDLPELEEYYRGRCLYLTCWYRGFSATTGRVLFELRADIPVGWVPAYTYTITAGQPGFLTIDITGWKAGLYFIEGTNGDPNNPNTVWTRFNEIPVPAGKYILQSSQLTVYMRVVQLQQ